MSESPDVLLRTWFEEVWNQKREDTIDRLFAPDCVDDGLPGGPFRGPDAFRPIFHRFHGAFNDIHVDVERSVTDGTIAVVHVRVTGTHTGDTLDIPATGRRVDFRGMSMAKLQNGQFIWAWDCYDFLTMYQQLGMELRPAVAKTAQAGQ